MSKVFGAFKDSKDHLRFFRKWVKALRSGKFTQTQGALLEFDNFEGTKSYCCLGVACSLRATELGVNPSELTDRGKRIAASEYVGEWLLPRDRQSHLADLNDLGKDFENIARIIEIDHIENRRNI